MDLDSVIERYRQPLLAIVAALYAMIGLAGGGMIERLKQPLYRKVLSLLRPAEAAVRRLIVVAARDLEVEPRPDHPAQAGRKKSGKGKRKGQRRRLFPLFDPSLREFSGLGRRHSKVPKAEPHVWSFDDLLLGRPHFCRKPEPAPSPEPEPDDSVSAKALCRRLAAITDALSDLSRHALRYARWRDKPYEERRPRRDTALRRGPPPGLREKSSHEVHEILKECHWLARNLPEPDSS